MNMKKGIEEMVVSDIMANMDAQVLARLKPPFGYEAITNKDGRVHFRIHDANDDAMATTYDSVYAVVIVEALNQVRK